MNGLPQILIRRYVLKNTCWMTIGIISNIVNRLNKNKIVLVNKIVKFVILRLQYWNKVRFPFSADVSFGSTFKGMSRNYKNTIFHGALGLGYYICDNCRLSARIGWFTSIAPYVRCNNGKHPYQFPFATDSPNFFSLNPAHNQSGSTFATRQMFDELVFVNMEKAISVEIGNDVWIGEGWGYSHRR